MQHCVSFIARTRGPIQTRWCEKSRSYTWHDEHNVCLRCERDLLKAVEELAKASYDALRAGEPFVNYLKAKGQGKMTAPRVFLDDISETPPVLEDGKLVMVEAREAAVKWGKESGDPYINLRIEVVDDPDDAEMSMFDTLPLPLEMKEQETQKAYKKRMDRRCFRLKRAVLAFGVKWSGALEAEELAEQFIGRRAWCRTKIEKDNREIDQSRPAEYFPESAKPA